MENRNLKQFARVGRVFSKELSKEILQNVKYTAVRAITSTANIIKE